MGNQSLSTQATAEAAATIQQRMGRGVAVSEPRRYGVGTDGSVGCRVDYHRERVKFDDYSSSRAGSGPRKRKPSPAQDFSRSRPDHRSGRDRVRPPRAQQIAIVNGQVLTSAQQAGPRRAGSGSRTRDWPTTSSLNQRMGAAEEWGPIIRPPTAPSRNLLKRKVFSAESELNISAAL